MGLINNMSGLTEGAVCIKKHISYFAYTEEITGCSCYNIIENTQEDIFNGEQVFIYKNINNNVVINTGDTNTCLVVSDFDAWVVWYINTIAISGYTGLSGTTENRVLYDTNNNRFYKIERFYDNCNKDKGDRYAIINNTTNNIWSTGDTENYYYDKIENCNEQTGVRYIRTRDINENSETFNNEIIIEKCQNETEPIVETTSVINITNTGATVNGVLISNGGFSITRIGVCFNRFGNPSVNDMIMETDIQDTYINAQLTGLTSFSIYYSRTFSENPIGVSYGETINFQTL